MITNDVNKEVYTFLIGLNDKDELQQKFESSDFENVLKCICENYRVGFSMQYIDGGYISDLGEYVKEKSLVLKIMDINKKQAESIATDICFFFNQECVRVTKEIVEVMEVRSK